MSHKEAERATGVWKDICFCQRPLIPVKVETAYKGGGYGLFDYESICYACGLPPEICTCPELHPRKKKLKLHEFPGPNGQTRKLKKALCEPSMFRQREGVVVTQSSFHRFDEGFPVVDEESEDNRQVPLGDWDDRRTSYPTLRAEKTFLTR